MLEGIGIDRWKRAACNAHRRGSPSAAKALCNIQLPKYQLAESRADSSDQEKRLSSSVSVASGKSGGSYIYRPSTLPRVSLTIRGQPPARVPSTLPTYVCIYAKTHFHLFFSLFFFSSFSPQSFKNHEIENRITFFF